MTNVWIVDYVADGKDLNILFSFREMRYDWISDSKQNFWLFIWQSTYCSRDIINSRSNVNIWTVVFRSIVKVCRKIVTWTMSPTTNTIAKQLTISAWFWITNSWLRIGGFFLSFLLPSFLNVADISLCFHFRTIFQLKVFAAQVDLIVLEQWTMNYNRIQISYYRCEFNF